MIIFHGTVRFSAKQNAKFKKIFKCKTKHSEKKFTFYFSHNHANTFTL